MAKEDRSGQTEHSFKDTTFKARRRDMVNLNGPMEMYIVVS